MTNPLEAHRWDRENASPAAHVFQAFTEVFDYAESLQRLLEAEQRARWAAEQDAAHWREQCEDLLNLCLDCWLQFSYLRVDHGRHSGGHSTLEALRHFLEEAGLIDADGRVKT